MPRSALQHISRAAVFSSNSLGRSFETPSGRFNQNRSILEEKRKLKKKFIGNKETNADKYRRCLAELLDFYRFWCYRQF